MSLVTAASRLIYTAGLRETRTGRRLIVSLNTIANRITRLLYAGERRYAEVDGHLVLLGDRSMPTWAFLNHLVRGRYEPETTALVNSLIREGMTVFDVGAHVGYYTLLAARRVGPAGRVYAFEPEPENFRILVENVEANGYRNVSCINMAVSDKSEMVEFYVNDEGNDLHSLINHSGGRRATTIHAQTISLDEFASSARLQTVDLVKIDIEGTESLAISGMSKLLGQHGSLNIILEFAPALIRNAGKHPDCVLKSLLDRGLGVSAVEGAIRGWIVTPEDVKIVVQEAERRGAVNLLCVNAAAGSPCHGLESGLV